MNCLVTAGPTYEDLDKVRRLTNFSTGNLGSQLSNFLVHQGHYVTLLLGQSSTCRIEPQTQEVEIFTTTDDLRSRLLARKRRKLDAVFHAAAISDFRFGKVFRRTAVGRLMEVRSRKFSTRQGTLIAELVPTQKLLAAMRDWFPMAWIVGWKYEVDGDRASVLAQAKRQLSECRTNACVANGPAYGQGFGLVVPGKPARHLHDATPLFMALAEAVRQGLDRRTSSVADFGE
jgi:phosphopantothenoylcysteine decarboxylase/phosphopantothenate--cysteine ligase